MSVDALVIADAVTTPAYYYEQRQATRQQEHGERAKAEGIFNQAE